MTHRVVHPCDPAEAAFLLPSGYRTAVSELTKGQALYFGDDMPVLVTTPYIAPDEIAWAAAQIPASVRPLDVPEAPPEPTRATSQVLYPPGVTTTNARLAYLLMQGWTYRQIERELSVSHSTIRKMRVALQRQGVQLSDGDDPLE